MRLRVRVLLIATAVLCMGAPPTRYHSIVAGGAHFCALSPDGSAFCWGLNGQGQRGDGTGKDSPTPVAVSGGLHFSTLGAGSGTTCGITQTDNKAYCWGDNSYGQLGNQRPGAPCPSPSGRTKPTVDCALSPAEVSGGNAFTQISTGSTNSCGANGAGNVYCWGDAGRRTRTEQSWRTMSMFGPPMLLCASKGAESKRGGICECGRRDGLCGHECGLRLLLGCDQYDTIGDGLGQHSNALSPVPVVFPVHVKLAALAKGAFAVCASSTKGVQCWGGNIEGTLGIGKAC